MEQRDAGVQGLPSRFLDVSLLAHGGQASTYAAFDSLHGREVVVKVLSLARVRDWKSFELFERECAVLAAVDHPGVPKFYEHFADEANGRWYLLMELVPGKPLSSSGRRRSEEELLRLLDRALDILVYLHGLRPAVIHRDIKPSNLVERNDGSLALVDFGGVTRHASRSGSSTMVGTFGYMAPEQLFGQAVPATDLYGLGATIAALAAGTEPEDLPRKGIEIDVDSVVSSSRLRAALSSMLRADVAERAQSVAAVRAAMDRTGALALVPFGRDLAESVRTGLCYGQSPRQIRIFAATAPALAVMVAYVTMSLPAGVIALGLYLALYPFGAGVVRGYLGRDP